MSPPHILLPSYTIVHRTTADSSGRTPRTETRHLPDSGTLPSLSHWQTPESSIPTSQSSPHNLPPPAPRSQHVNHARTANPSRCPEPFLTRSGRTARTLTLSDPTPPAPGNLSAPLLTQKKSLSNTAVRTHGPAEIAFAPSPSILDSEAWPSYDSIDDAAHCLVYRSVDDWLPTSPPPPPPPPSPPTRQRTAIRPPVRIPERTVTAISDAAFASNMAAPLRKDPLPASRRISPRFPDVHPKPLRAFFGFTALTQSLARLSGELAASAVAGYQNHYGDPSARKRGGEESRFGRKWKAEWEEDMRALEMEEWIVDGNALM